MSQTETTGIKTFTGAAALGAFLRVADNGSDKMALAGLSEPGIGVVEHPTFAVDEPVSVRTWKAPGTAKMTASAAITGPAYVYAAASGKVAPTGTVVVGYTLEDASGDGSIIEVFPLPQGALHLGDVKTVAATGSAQGDAAALTGVVNVVTGGDDTTGVILPTAATTSGLVMVLNSGSAGLDIYPATGDKINNGSANAPITILENTFALLVATAADNWGAIFTVNS